MKKAIFALALAFAFVGTASAASITNIEFSNGDVTIDGKGGTTTNVELRIVVPAGEVVEYVQTDVDGDSLGPVDHKVGGNLGLQEGTHYVKVPVKFPPNTGTYDLDVQTAGIFGGIRSINGDDGVNGSDTFGGALRVVANASNNDDEVGGDAEFTAILTSIDQLNSTLIAVSARLEALENPTPTASGKCATLAQKLVGTLDFGRNEANTRLQGYLLSENMSIPALAAGASFGYKGPQTNAAISAFKSANGCV